MADMLFPGENLDPRLLNERADSGDEKAKMIFERMGEALGIAIATVSQIFNAPLYVLSGGVLPAWHHFAPRMIEEASRRSFNFRHCSPTNRIVPAKLGGLAGLYGAAYLPMSGRNAS
jgi:glucokinase